MAAAGAAFQLNLGPQYARHLARKLPTQFPVSSSAGDCGTVMTPRWRWTILAGLFLSLSLAAVAGVKHANKHAPTIKYATFYRPLTKPERFEHASDRLTFGPRPGDLQEIQDDGLDRWIKAQLHPEKLSENPSLAHRLEPYQSLRADIHEIYAHYPPPQMIRAFARGEGRLPEDPELRATVVQLGFRYRQKEQSGSTKPPELSGASLNAMPVALRRELIMTVNPENVVATDLTAGKLLRAIYSSHQLQELLVDFWFNHFNIFIGKGADHYLISSYERDVIRPRVYGKFYDLLLATAKSPAMLFYLDNWQSVGPQAEPLHPPRPRRAKRGLNENYGRELLELHTLGVDGGYTQKDVIEVARCFTGWTMQPPRKGGEFAYIDRVHDKGEKIVLGHVIPAGGGIGDGLTVLNILAHHPATAHFISLELARKFVADDPPPALINRMAKTFLKTDGDLRQVMQTMLKSPEFWSQGAFQAKVKTPFEMIVSAVRATNAAVDTAYALGREIQRLGEPLYKKIEPTGYSNANTEWVSSAGLLDRMNFALALAQNHVGGVRVDTAWWQEATHGDPEALARSLLQREPREETLAAIRRMLANPRLQKQLTANVRTGPPPLFSLVAGLVMGSPEFQHR